MVAERDFDVMNQAEIRKAAKELGVCQRGVNVAELKDACKRAAADVGKERAGRDFDVLNQAELRKAAKELGVRQSGASFIELKDACKRAVWEARRQITFNACMAGKAHVAESAAAPLVSQLALTAWLAGNARVSESAAAPLDSNLEDSGAGAVLGTVRQALPAARKRRQEPATPLFKAKWRQEHVTPLVKAKRWQERATPGVGIFLRQWEDVSWHGFLPGSAST